MAQGSSRAPPPGPARTSCIPALMCPAVRASSCCPACTSRQPGGTRTCTQQGSRGGQAGRTPRQQTLPPTSPICLDWRRQPGLPSTSPATPANTASYLPRFSGPEASTRTQPVHGLVPWRRGNGEGCERKSAAVIEMRRQAHTQASARTHTHSVCTLAQRGEVRHHTPTAARVPSASHTCSPGKRLLPCSVSRLRSLW